MYDPLTNRVDYSRRGFLGTTLAATVAGSVRPIANAAEADSEAPQRKLKLGLVGCGGRGTWISKLFSDHGGYQWHALTDYFTDRSNQLGETLGVDAGRRFSGLGGYKRVIESGIDALVIKTPPYCIAEIAAAGVDAGLHIYAAKPVAVDVPGCTSIGASTAQAKRSRQVFLVDYQIPTDPNNQVVRDAVRAGQAGKLVRVATVGINGGWADPPRGANIEPWLKDSIWNNHIALSGGKSVGYDIHAIDAAIWLLGARPVAAIGSSRIVRPNPQGDSIDISSVVFEYADGLIHEHSSQGLPNHTTAELSCQAYSYNSRAFINYWLDALFQTRGVKPLGGPVENLYDAGAKRNVADFHRAIVEEDYGNETGFRTVDCILTTILGREAAARGSRLTMEELIKENRRIEPDLEGLKA